VFRAAVVLIAVGLVVYAAICGALYFAQRSMLYFPTAESRSQRAEVLKIAADGAVLKVWHVPIPGDGALLYFGGNGEDVASNIAPLSAALPHAALFLANYRGYGGSTGAPSEKAILADAEILFDRVQAQHARVAVVGRSLGSGVAVHLASVRDVSKLVLVTPYDSVLRIAQGRLPFVPVSWLLEDTFDSLSKAPRVHAPVLVLLAERDSSIPRANSERLVSAFGSARVSARTFSGADHNSISDSPEYWRAVADFVLN
jgi:pimeloyl-ACP methyl ester carboxylesterase